MDISNDLSNTLISSEAVWDGFWLRLVGKFKTTPANYTCVFIRLSGYLFKRVSRTAAFLVGCTFIVFQVRKSVSRFIIVSCLVCSQGATALGVVSVNWNRLQSIARRNMRLAEGHVSVIRRASGLEDDNSSFSESVSMCVLLISHHIELGIFFHRYWN